MPGLIRELRALGVNASHHFAVAEEEYRQARSAGARARVRWQCYASYPRALYSRLRDQSRPAVAVVCTNTFYAPALAIRAALGRGTSVVNWIFDLFPDVLVQSGTLRPRGLPDLQLGNLSRWAFQRASANVFLGHRLQAFAERRYGQIRNANVIFVGGDGEAFRAAEPQQRPTNAPLRILYSGNLGRMHDVQTVLELLRQPGSDGWTMDFRGHGAGFRELASATNSAQFDTSHVTFGGSLPTPTWVETLKAADVALVTMKRGCEGLVMPSKTYSAMAAGQAILAICPRESDLADTVLRHAAGWVVEPGDVAGLRDVLKAATRQPEKVLEMRRRAFDAAHSTYDQRAAAARWAGLLDTLLSSPR